MEPSLYYKHGDWMAVFCKSNFISNLATLIFFFSFDITKLRFDKIIQSKYQILMYLLIQVRFTRIHTNSVTFNVNGYSPQV